MAGLNSGKGPERKIISLNQGPPQNRLIEGAKKDCPNWGQNLETEGVK
jgi:hypothetical protein